MGRFPKVVTYGKNFVDTQNGHHAYWDEDIYDQDKLEYIDTHNKHQCTHNKDTAPNDETESDELITDALVADALWYSLLDLWTVTPYLHDTSPLPNFQQRPKNQQWQIALIDDQIIPQLQVTPDRLTRFLPLSTNKPLNTIK